MTPLFIIEDCEPQLWDWSRIEYEHVSNAVGKEHLWITNTTSEHLSAFAKTTPKSVTELHLEHACILDPHAEHTLTPEIAKKYTHFIFGGILGDNPPSKKTQHLITSRTHWPAYNLGTAQMPTDTAIMAVKKIYEGTPIEQLHFAQRLEVVTGDGESATLDFTYLIIDGKPFIDPRIIELLQHEDTF